MESGLARLYNLIPYQCRALNAGKCGVEVEGGRVPTSDWMLNLQILTGLWRFCAASRWLTEKALEYREIIGQFRRFLTGRLQEGTCVFGAMLTHDVGHRT